MIIGSPIIKEELFDKILVNTKGGKATGTDGIPAELLKYLWRHAQFTMWDNYQKLRNPQTSTIYKEVRQRCPLLVYLFNIII